MGGTIAFRRDGQADFYECALAEEFALQLFIPDTWLSRLDRPTPEKVARRCLVTWRAARLRLLRPAPALYTHPRRSNKGPG